MTVIMRYPHYWFFAFVALLLLQVHAAGVKENGLNDTTERLVSVLEDEILQCAPIQRLSVLRQTLEAQHSPVMRTIFSWLFPFGPAWNSVLGTFYISSVPNFILAFIPADINGDTLNTMTAFATGGLLSDVFLHLIPHSFMGEHQGSGVHFVIVEEKRNILIGLGIFIGFATFFFMEKTLRVLGGDEDAHSHSHSHPHPHVSPEVITNSSTDRSASEDGLRSRNSNKTAINGSSIPPQLPKTANGPSKLSAYLNLFGDFVHNITDGLAMAASFYASPLIGATTTLACFAHEIPHEIADYSILIRSGFSKKQAMQSQFLTAIGAFVGYVQSGSKYTFIGIAVHNATATTNEDQVLDLAAGIRQDATGLLGTTLQLSDLVIPFVAGGFLYIGAVAVLPTERASSIFILFKRALLLAESKSGKQAMREFAAMAFGVLCMFMVAWNE
ncbi:Zip-domain-containing protein [Phlegmacium glaucopus]|nr:Zip-domain-containing protein [Phlegmacium glaucopus]